MNTSKDLKETIKEIKEKVKGSSETISDMHKEKEEDAKCKNPCSNKCKCMHTQINKPNIHHS